MATHIESTPVSDVAILSRLIRPEVDDLPPEGAEAFLRIRFAQSDLDRMHELAAKNQDDRLTPIESAVLDHYRRVSYMLDLMHSKARRSLKKHRPAS